MYEKDGAGMRGGGDVKGLDDASWGFDVPDFCVYDSDSYESAVM